MVLYIGMIVGMYSSYNSRNNSRSDGFGSNSVAI